MTFINNGKSPNQTHYPTSKFFPKGYSAHNWFGGFWYEKYGILNSCMVVYGKEYALIVYGTWYWAIYQLRKKGNICIFLTGL